MADKTFLSDQQKLNWDAFSGKCGKEFAGNPFFMQNFMEIERPLSKEDEGQGRERV